MDAYDVFIDSNILIYAHDRDAGPKYLKARGLIEALWRARKVPSLSIQVLQEVHVNLTRKGVSPEVSASTVSNYLSWHVIQNSESVLRLAFSEQQRWGMNASPAMGYRFSFP